MVTLNDIGVLHQSNLGDSMSEFITMPAFWLCLLLVGLGVAAGIEQWRRRRAKKRLVVEQPVMDESQQLVGTIHEMIVALERLSDSPHKYNFMTWSGLKEQILVIDEILGLIETALRDGQKALVASELRADREVLLVRRLEYETRARRLLADNPALARFVEAISKRVPEDDSEDPNLFTEA